MKKLSTPILAAVFTLIGGTAAAQTTTTFSYTGSVQTFVVPACVTQVTVDVIGASGGNINTATGGLGGRVQCVLPVTPGETLQVFVGGAGANGDNTSGIIAGGFNGGGHGFDNSDPWGGAGGGGASDIRRSPYNLNDRKVVAGGGGGGGIDGCSSANMLNGGNGGGLIGADGAPSPNTCVGSGQGGTQTAGGLKGQYPSCTNLSTDGSFGLGGEGYGNCSNSDEGGSGGGGGWYGGGGGNFGAGGGGSSYTDGSCTSVVHTQGYQTGNGVVLITYTPGLTLTATAAMDTICSGGCTTVSCTPTGTSPFTYDWQPGNMTTSSANVCPSATTCYTVTVTDANGCSSTTSTCVTVLNCTSTEDIEAHMMSAYPNPFTNYLTIGLNEKAELNLYNLIGEHMGQWLMAPGDNRIEAGHLAPGVYFITIKTAHGTYTKKIIKE
ncbi:MAG: T9SS type A sorting domain-containing protein [Bacteroidota bacterium]